MSFELICVDLCMSPATVKRVKRCHLHSRVVTKEELVSNELERLLSPRKGWASQYNATKVRYHNVGLGSSTPPSFLEIEFQFLLSHWVLLRVGQRLHGIPIFCALSMKRQTNKMRDITISLGTK